MTDPCSIFWVTSNGSAGLNSMALTCIILGIPKSSATWEGTWAVEPSRVKLPQQIRSKGARRPMAVARIREVARVSEPANHWSDRSTARSAPMASASRKTGRAAAGAMASSTTSAPQASLISRAASRACLSKGLITLGIPSRINVLVTGSIASRSQAKGSGTGLRQTIIFSMVPGS